MTTDDASSPVDGRAREVTRLPARGSVLVQSSAPPEVPTERCVDVRPGPFATFDGDRLRLSLVVRAAGERRCFDRSELPAVEEAVATLLRGPTPANVERAATEHGERRVPVEVGRRATVDGERLVADDRRRAPGADSSRSEPAVVRYGDRAACRGLLPAATGHAIERRLAAAARRGSATLLAWTTGSPRAADYRTFDVVLDRRVARPD